MATLTSPFWLATKAWSASRPACSMSAIVALDTLALGPSSPPMGNASRAVFPGPHRDRGIAALHHVSDTGHAPDRGSLEALHLATEYWAVLDRGIEHPGQFHVEPIDLGAGQLFQRVEALHRLPDELPVLRVLERHVGRRGKLRRGGRPLAGRGRAAGGPVRDHAVSGTALGGRHPPGVGGGLDEHR